MNEPEPARRLTLRGTVARRHEADALAVAPGDAVLVHRERPRALVIACPDGCGERLTVNLDPNLGPPWRLYSTRRGLSLYPSVWRDSGCRSHFIVWHDTVLWCDRWEDGNQEPAPQRALPDLVQEVENRLGPRLQPYATIAAQMEEIPWDVLRACRALVRLDKAVEGAGHQCGWFRRREMP